LLSDIRLNSDAQTHAVHNLEKKINDLGYTFKHNSKISARGVGILIKKKLEAEILDSIPDPNHNYLALKLKIKGVLWAVCAIYGPNKNDVLFYTDLENSIRHLNCDRVVIAGDWNATWDSRPAAYNPDVINMANIPSKIRSDAVINMASNIGLTDPYRVKYPIKRDFTYIPNARMNINRSRLDFFFN
jgi:exonuclease III